MPISINEIRNASSRFATVKKQTINEARASGMQTAFLCHSHKDQKLVEGLVTLLNESGWRVYVDWADSSMPETPNRQTAEKIKQRIVSHNLFLFLATANSMASR
jgi:TIR domain